MAILSTDVFFEYMMVGKKGIKMPRGDKKVIPNFEVPVPPMDIQKQIAIECKELNQNYASSRMEIETSRRCVEKIFKELETVTTNQNSVRLSDSNVFTLMIGKRVIANDIHETGTYPVYSANVFEPFGYTEDCLTSDFSSPSIIWGIDGDWQVNLIPKDLPFYPTDHCGVMRITSNDIHPRYMAWALEKAGRALHFNRDLRASLDRIRDITIRIPPRDSQWDAMVKVESLENKIKELESSCEKLLQEQQAILDKYLR
jgi:restriction endonuclease S subunit